MRNSACQLLISKQQGCQLSSQPHPCRLPLIIAVALSENTETDRNRWIDSIESCLSMSGYLVELKARLARYGDLLKLQVSSVGAPKLIPGPDGRYSMDPALCIPAEAPTNNVVDL